MFTGPNEGIQAWLVESDHRLLRIASRAGLKFGPSARLTMEWAYALCYPLVPLGLGTLYVAGMRWAASAFWFFVLVPTYLCYAITPFVPALPPRSIGLEGNGARRTKSRVFNLWLLKYGSIQAISFPSAHVAAALALSLVLIKLVPLAGWVFLVITFWIAVAAVVGRYHYTIDVVLGAVVTLAVFAAWWAHLIPNTLITAPATALLALL
jgi:membrane-associated phospholipid phosphatase